MSCFSWEALAKEMYVGEAQRSIELHWQFSTRSGI